MDLLTASLDEEFIELVNATLGRWMPARVRNMSYSDYFNVMCPLMCSEAVCDSRPAPPAPLSCREDEQKKLVG